MGQVFHATDPELSRELAVKVLLDDAIDEASRARFHNEMKALTRIGNHPGVVQFYAKDSTPRGDDVMVMAFLDGGTLSSVMKQRAHTGRGFTIDEVVHYLKPIAGALDYMHHELQPGWVHRDVKPANILLRQHPGSLAPSVLTDFGISIQEGQSRLTKVGHIVGTEKYAAPENNGHSHGDDDLSARADDYSLALIAFEMLTLHHLKDTMPRSEWEGKRRLPDLTSAAFAKTLAPETARVATEVQRVLSRALDSVPMHRYETAQEFISALDGAARSTPSSSAQATPQQQTWHESAPAVEHMYTTGFAAPTHPVSSTPFVGPATPVTPVPPATPVTPIAPAGGRVPAPKKDNSNALIIAATVVVIILIFVVTWAVVA